MNIIEEIIWILFSFIAYACFLQEYRENKQVIN